MKKNGTAISYENTHRPRLIYHRRHSSLPRLATLSRSSSYPSSRLSVPFFIYTSRLYHFVYASRISSRPPPSLPHGSRPASSPHPHIDIIRHELDNDNSNTVKNELNKTARLIRLALSPPRQSEYGETSHPAPTPYDGKKTPSPPSRPTRTATPPR